MTIGRFRKSSARAKGTFKRREQSRRQESRRGLRIEALEDRRLMATGPQLVGIQPNQGDLLKDGDVLNTAPRELVLHFDEVADIDEATLDAIQVTRAGGDGQFDVATARTDFNTAGQVIVEFRAKSPGDAGNDVALTFTKRNVGKAAPPVITVEGRTIRVELNSTAQNQTTAQALVNAINSNGTAKLLVEAVVVSGPTSTNIATPTINYSPLNLRGGNQASVSSNFNSGGNLDITFTAVQTGAEGNGIRIEVTKVNRGGAGSPTITVNGRTIQIALNSNPGNETTASQLVTVFNANPLARALAVASNTVGSPTTKIGLASTGTAYSPLLLGGANDVALEPGYVGLGDTAREVIFRFAEPLPDDIYRIDIAGTGTAPLRSVNGYALGDTTDDGLDNGQDFARPFELDLGAQVLAVVPQPITRGTNGLLVQATTQIEVYFNDDDLVPALATNPNFYQLIFTNDTAQTTDDVVHKPIAVQYYADSDRAVLTFSRPLHQLGSGSGAFRLRIGTDEAAPAPPTAVDLQTQDAGSSFDTAHTLGSLSGSLLVSSAIEPQVYELALPGASDEPGHRTISEQIQAHLLQPADAENGIATIFYNFRGDYGTDPAGNKLSNLISAEQKARAREAFELWGQAIGVQFVETASQGIVVATGDMRALNPAIATGRGDGVVGLSGLSPVTGQPTVIMDSAENWYVSFGQSDDPLRPYSWFETSLREIGRVLGLGDTSDLPPGTIMGSDPALAYGNTDIPEPVYPGDQDIVHGRNLYRNEGKDIDLYRFEVTQSGVLSAEVMAERLKDASLLDSVIAVYRQSGSQRELIGRNDDYFSKDSFLELTLEPGVYYLGVSAAGNVDYNPAVEDTGFGGVSEGSYELRMTFRPNAGNSLLDVDNALTTGASAISQATSLDGDGDGVPGGVFNYWFRVDATPIIVDKTAASGGNGNLSSPFNTIGAALQVARTGDVVRIVGNGGTDGNLGTPEDNVPYLIGFDLLSRALPDGDTLNVPQGVSVVIDRGAVLKLRRTRIGVGSFDATTNRSGGALQVLGTPRLVDSAGFVVKDSSGNPVSGQVTFTSYNDEVLGGDSNPSNKTTPAAGDWGGIMFRRDLDQTAGRLDWENAGVFLNCVNQADIRYGGGSVVVNQIAQTVSPIHAIDARPTVTFNSITHSADAALSANPDSFEETNFHAPRYQTVPFTSDYTRIGPVIYGNRIVDNSINGLFVRLTIPAGSQLEEMTVSGRWDDADVVHVLAENLRIAGNPGGPVQTLAAPATNLVTLTRQAGGAVPEGIQSYKLTFVDAAGNESPPSDPTSSVLVQVTNTDTGATQNVLLQNLPTTPSGYVSRRLYRSDKSEYVLVAELDAATRTYLDTGTVLGGRLTGSSLSLQSRLHGRLAVDPGTVVKLNGAGIETGVGAQLIAEGLSGSEVIFTALQDDRYGSGGTFATSYRDDLQAGSWTGLYFGPASQASLDHAVLAYGGGVSKVPGNFASFNVVEIQQADARITNSVFEQNADGTGGQASPNRGGRGPNDQAAIFVRGAQPVLVGNEMTANKGPVINIDVNSLNYELLTDPGRSTGGIDRRSQLVANAGPLIRENRLSGNELNGMVVRGGTLTTEGVWDDTDIVHVVLDDTIYVPDFHTYGGLRLESSATQSLVVKLAGDNAGFTATGSELDITDRIGGAMYLLGQPGQPVVLTALNDCSVGAGFTPAGSPQVETALGVCGVPDKPGAGGLGPLVVDQVTTDANLLRDTLLGPGVIPVGDATFVGGTASAGIFSTGLSSIGIDSGVILATGDADVAAGPNTNEFSSGLASGQGDADLDTEFGFVAGGLLATEDTTVLEFDFQLDPTASQDLYFNFVFASEEYNEFANSLFNDVFAFFIDDVNIAFIPGTTTPISINTVNGGFPLGTAPVNPQYYNNNGIFDNGQYLNLLGYDGFTEVFTAQALGIGPGTHHIKLAISDVADTAWDSAVFLQLGSFANVQLGTPPQPGDWRGVQYLENAHDRNVDTVSEWETGNATISGTNDVPGQAQALGTLAPNEKAADDTRRLGFHVRGALNRPTDLDVYSFQATAGTEVWLDIDRTSHALDTVLELVDEQGLVLARSDNSAEEAENPNLLYADPTLSEPLVLNPLDKSVFDSQDRWTANPLDAGMRVVLPGPVGVANTYQVRVRSSSNQLGNLNAGLTTGVYQLQVRLRELDEVPGSTVRMADIRYADTGIEVTGGPSHSPLTGDAAEALDAQGNDTNNDLTTPDNLGNLLTTDRGTLSVAGALANAGDVDWYQFDVQYSAVQTDDPAAPRHTSVAFDIDYADGFARANTNLWVFDATGQLVLVGGDSDTLDDRPVNATQLTEDLSRGSVGALDPFIGPVELPAASTLEPGRYFVAVSSNAQLPQELEQFLVAAPINPLVRLEPVNSVNRIAEDHIAAVGDYNTAEAPTVPVLFGLDDRVTLFIPAGNVLQDGETLTVTNAAGGSMTYEFDADGSVTAGRVAIEYSYSDTATDIGLAAAEVISLNLPPSYGFNDILPDPTADSPVIISDLAVGGGANGQIVLGEFVYVQTLLSEISSTDPFTNQTLVTPITRTTSRVQDPQVRQAAAPGEARATVYISRPAVIDYTLGDVTMFVSEPSFSALNRTEVVSVDAFTGAQETRIGYFGATVSDIAMHPRGYNPATDDGNDGGLFAYSIPDTYPHDDEFTGNYWQINPGLDTQLNVAADIGANVGDDGIETYEEDPTDPGTEIRSDVGTDEGVGIDFNALTFSGQDQGLDDEVRGFAVGNRGDTYVDPITGQVLFSGAYGIPDPVNLLFEFDPDTGEAINPQGVNDKTGAAILTAGGTQIWQRGVLDTTADPFPSGGTNTTVTGVDATTVTTDTLGNLVTIVNIEDGDFFQIDRDGNGVGDVGFEFDTGPEYLIAVNTFNAANPQVLRDGDRFTVDGIVFEFDTGSVIVVTAQNGGQLTDGTLLTITDNAATPSTVTFEFDNNATTAGNVPITFNQTSNQQAIVNAIISAIAGVPNFGVQAVQLPGTNRLTLIGESPNSGAATNATGIAVMGQPGVAGAAIAVPVEENDTEDLIGAAIAGAVNTTAGLLFQAGAAGIRVNFAGALTADFTGVSNPAIFTADGVAGTLNPFRLPIPFLVDDTSQEIADRVYQTIVGTGISATLQGSSVLLDAVSPPAAQPEFICISYGTPPQIGAPGIPDCPLLSGGSAPGGSITGIAFVGRQLYAVSDTGGLFRVTSGAGGAFAPNSAYNVADYIDGSQALLQAVNNVTTVDVLYTTPLTFGDADPDTIIDPDNGFVDAGFVAGGRLLVSGTGSNDGEYTIAAVSPGTITLVAADALVAETVTAGARLQMVTTAPVRFSGLVTGPQNAEDGRYENLLFGITETGRIFAFDTWGRPQAVFANAQYYVDTGVIGAHGVAFSNLDDNLWHATDRRDTAPGHNVLQAFDGSRGTEIQAGNASLYFGFEGPLVQSQFGSNNFSPNTPANTYDFPGGAQGTVISNPLSLEGYSAADKPTLYFDYWLDTENADANGETSLTLPDDLMRDAFRVYISGDDGRWKLLSTNNSDRGGFADDDEFDPFPTQDPVTGLDVAEQPFTRGELFDSANPQAANDPWRQARVDLSPYAGQKNLRLRFDFSTAGGMSSGGRNFTLDLNTAGNELRALSGSELRDGQMFTLTDLVLNPVTDFYERVEVVGFEFDFGPTIVAPTGAAIDDGDRFEIDGTVYEFDLDGSVGVTNSIPHVRVAFTGLETGGELAQLIQDVVTANPPEPVTLQADLIADEADTNDTLATAYPSGLTGKTQTLSGTGYVGDNFSLGANVPVDLDVDLVEVYLDAGDQIVVQTDTQRLATQLDAYLRLFDASGAELAANDNLDPTSPFIRDAKIEYTATERGTYYVGISAAHNRAYSPLAMGSGTAATGQTVSQGYYEFSIVVTDPNGPQRVGNRLNLPNAGSVVITGLPDSFIEGAAGVASGIPNPMADDEPTLPDVPVVPVRLSLTMSNLEVADAIRVALADYLGNGNADAFKSRHESIQIIGYGIGDPGPLGLSGPSDPTTSLPESGLFGDAFGAFNASAGRNGLITAANPGAVRMQDNQHEGAYIDNILIGFASRGEMVTGSSPSASPPFVANTTQAGSEIDEGAYQLEIRQATEYGQTMSSAPTLALFEGFDVNDRLVDGVSLTSASGHFYRDGQTFTLSDGTGAVTFEFEDLTVENGVAADHAAIPFDPSDNDVDMARRIRDAINTAADDGQLAIRALSGDGIFAGSASTSNLVHLSGGARVTVGAATGSSESGQPAPEENDTLPTAIDTGMVAGSREGYRGAGVIGDNPAVRPFGAEIDLFRVELAAGELLTIDIDATELNSPLDSVVRIFDANGAPVLQLDDFGLPVGVSSDDDVGPGEWATIPPTGLVNRDSYLVFTAPADGVYYIGVSGFDNNDYDPRTLGVGSSNPADITFFNGEVYFTAFTPATGRELWKLDSTGTPVLAADIDLTGSSAPAELTVFNNELYFTADSPVTGREIWKLDTAGQASLVVDVFSDGSSAPSDLTVYNNALYFAATTTASGRELWKTTPGGVATEVADIDPFGSSDPADLTVFNNELYFSAFASSTGRELWKVDATGVMANVADLDPNGSSDPAGLTEFNGELYFAATFPATGRELWKVSAFGLPSQLTDIDPAGSSDPAGLQVFNNELYFAATAPLSGRELWKVDAVGNSTLVADIDPAASSEPTDLTVFNNGLYFSATGPTAGRELWQLNASGVASQVADLEAGGSSAPEELSVAGNVLYFSAFTTAAGRELWRLNAAGAVSSVADLDRAERRDGVTGYYEIEIQRPLNANGVGVANYTRSGDANLFRDQGQLVIRDSSISDSAGYGIVVQAGARSATGAPSPGPVRNLAEVNTARLAPSVTVTNNILAYNQAGGIRFSGDPGNPAAVSLQPATVPFGRIVNNTVYGADRNAFQLTPADIVFVTDTSGSMADDVQAIRQQIDEFDTLLMGSGIDPRYGLVTFPGDGATPVQIQDLTDFATFTAVDSPFSTFAVPAGGSKEYGSLAVSEAMNGVDPLTTFTFRPGSQVLTVLFTDEEDDSTAAEFNAALASLRARSAIFFGITLNPDVPNDVDSATNNTAERYGAMAAATGGGLYDIATFARDPLPFFTGFTQAITGVLAATGTTGIVVENNASPTLLNNIVAALETGIRVDATSATTVVGGTVYQGNGTDTLGIATESFPLRVANGVPLFRDPYFGNFYPAPGAPIIDSSVDALEDRLTMVQVSQPLGIAASPIQTPDYDAYGQLRLDDPAVAPPPGLGENVFKDRGAVDRSDFAGPGAKLVYPLDNGSEDRDPNSTMVNLVRTSLDEFSIQLGDGQAPLFGSGVDDASVAANSVRVIQDARELTPGVDFSVWYDFTNNILHIVPLAGVWDLDSNYVIKLQNQDRFLIEARSGEEVADGDSFRLEDAYGNSFTFEYDTGFVLTVPQTYAIQVPLAGGAAGGVGDGDLVTVDYTIGTQTITEVIEFDNNGVIADANYTVASFTALSTQGEVADALVKALKSIGLGLNPANTGAGLVHLGVDGSQTLTVTSATLVPQGGPVGVVDGDTFTVDNGSRLFTFELSTDGVVGTGRVPVRFAMSQTEDTIAQAIAVAVNGQPVGLVARALDGGRVQLGGEVNHQVDVTLSHLLLTGEPGVQLPFGIRIPTEAGSFKDLIADGETFVIRYGGTQTVTFELDSNNTIVDGNVRVPFTSATTTQQLADTLVNTIRDSGLGLFPYNAGNGIVILGGEGYSLDMSLTALYQVGISGQPGALSIPVTPDESFGPEQVADATANAINALGLPGITATADPQTDDVAVQGATSLSGDAVQFYSAIKDLAGNSIIGNQANGETRFTVFIGVGMDYGDAPAPYPTLRENDGARHVVLAGFSLGATVDVNADGQPSVNADGDALDEDGVVFDPTTPLVPSRTFTLTVSTRGITNDVVSFGVLDGWIDFNRDGDWTDAGERILTNVILNKSVLDDNGSITFRTLAAPSWAVPGVSYARFRLSTTGGLSTTGEAADGEVEDYRVVIIANPWQNSPNVYDVNNDGGVSPVDALLLINYINSSPTNPLPLPKPAGYPFYDVSGDGNASAQDVLMVINEINRLNTQQSGEGEGMPAARAGSTHLDDVLRNEETWQDVLEDVGRVFADGDAVDDFFADLGR